MCIQYQHHLCILACSYSEWTYRRSPTPLRGLPAAVNALTVLKFYATNTEYLTAIDTLYNLTSNLVSAPGTDNPYQRHRFRQVCLSDQNVQTGVCGVIGGTEVLLALGFAWREQEPRLVLEQRDENEQVVKQVVAILASILERNKVDDAATQRLATDPDLD